MKKSAGFDLRLGEVVLKAAGLEGAERDRYLETIALEDSDLKEEALRRLAAAEELPDSFLGAPAALRLGPSVAPETTLSAVALPAGERYELGECLGEGGMGRVFEAYDRQLGRTVALKLLSHDDPEILRLFLGEARAQARIGHDNVLEVYDSGEIAGQPFIAMRYVAGGTLADLAAALPLELKVSLLVQVAEGLHAAHREGLLHRDVKPSNILIERKGDGELRALVSDFGLAVALGDAEEMAAEALAGSPQFIAPERLAGSRGMPATVDRRSDIYSLGVTMYWFLTGDLPFTGKNTVEILRHVVHQELPPPRRRMPGLPAELEAVILRCVAREPGERYASARAVAADLRRYLDGEVVEAYAASLAYRLTRFVLRRKLLVGMALVVLVVLALSSVAIAIFALRADAARQRAEQRQAQAEELIRFMLVDLRKKLDSLARLDILDEVGEAALGYFAAVPEAELSTAELERRSQMLYQIGEVRIKEGNVAGALAPMQQSLSLAQRLALLEPENGERLFALGQSQYWVGFVHWEQGNLEATRGPFEAYLEVSRQLAEKDPAKLEWQRELSYAHSNLGSLRQAEGDLAGALEQFQATLAIDEALVAADRSREALSELAATHNTIGAVLQDLGRLREAGDELRADLEIRRQLLEQDPADRRLQKLYGVSLGTLGIHLLMQGKKVEAARQFGLMEEVFTQLTEYDPANTDWSYQLAWCHLERGRVAYAQGELAQAGKAWLRAQQMIDDLLAKDALPHKWRRTQAIILYYRALLELPRDRAAARGNALTAVEILTNLGASRATDRSVHRWLSQSYLLLGRLATTPAEADAAFEQALRTIEPFAEDSRDGRLLAPWVAALTCLGRSEAARPALEILKAQAYFEPGMSELCQECVIDFR